MAPVARRWLTHLAWLSVLATPLSAQAVATFDVDGARVRYTDSLTITAASVTPGFRLTRPSALVLGSGTVSRFDNNTWSGQGSLVAAGFTRPRGRFRGEVGGATGGSIHQDGSGVAYLLGRGRAHFQSGMSGAWAGAGIGRTWDGDRWRSLFLGEGSVWTRVRDATLLATITPTAVADSGSYLDFEASIRWDRGVIEATAWLGGRTRSGTGSRGWGGVSATGWIARHVAVTGGAGSYPDDFTQSVPAGRYLTLGMRLSSEPRVPRSLVNRMLAREAPPLARPVAAGFELATWGGPADVAVQGARRSASGVDGHLHRLGNRRTEPIGAGPVGRHTGHRSRNVSHESSSRWSRVGRATGCSGIARRLWRSGRNTGRAVTGLVLQGSVNANP